MRSFRDNFGWSSVALAATGTLGTIAAVSVAGFCAIYPAFPSPSGPLSSVGCVKSEVSNHLAVQVFYPTDETSSTQYEHYMRPEALNGLADWLCNKHITKMLSHLKCRHPRLYGASVMPTDDGWPIIIFSPGMGSTYEVYTQIASDLASYGHIVFVPEHTDGSGSYCKGSDGEPILFTKHNHPYTRNAICEFRKGFLQHRVSEIERVINDICSNSNEVGDVLKPILQHLNTSQILMAGHSFGSATAVLTVQKLPDTFYGCILYDLWPFPLHDEVLSKGLAIPTLSILSEVFARKDESEYTKSLLHNTKRNLSLYIPGSVHQAFSDSPYWLPEWIGRKTGTCGSKSMTETRRAMVNISNQFIEVTAYHIDRLKGKGWDANQEYLESIVESDSDLFFFRN